MEGLFVRFKETDHPIWIGTHKFGMVEILPNHFSSRSLRKLYTVEDAIAAFKTAVSPDVDDSSLTLHFEPNREPIPLHTLLAAIQLENSFENPLYIKCTPEVSSIKSKDADSVKYGCRRVEMWLDTESAVNFNLLPSTTLTTPHKVVKLKGVTHFIAKCRAGDYVIHSWNPNDMDGYCGEKLAFKCDNGCVEEVKGPYLMDCDWRNYKELVAYLRMPEFNQKAYKVTVGTKVEKKTSISVSYDDFGEIVFKEEEFSVGPISARIRKEWYDVMHIKIERRHQWCRFFPLVTGSKLED